MRKKLFIGVLTGVAVLIAAPLVLAAFTQKADIRLTVKREAKPTGVRADLEARDPEAEGQKPKIASRVVIRLPRGTRYNPAGAAQCNGKTDTQILAGDCPAASRIGGGTAIANAYPLIASTTEDIVVFHTRNGVIFRLTDNADDPQPGQALIIRGTLTRRGVLTANVPPLLVPGTSAKVALTDFTVSLQRRVRNGNALLRTPRVCNGAWRTVAAFTYDDGSSLSVPTTQRCRRR